MPYQKHYFIIVTTLKKPRVPLLGPTGISTVNIGANTVHFGLGIKPGTNLLGLNDKSKAALRNRLSEVKILIIIDELSIVSSDLWTQGWEKYL